jgi:hypothetical protein
MCLGADPSGRAVCGVDLLPLTCWDGGFESRRANGHLMNVVFCQSFLRRADPSSREVLRRVCVCVCDFETSNNEAA